MKDATINRTRVAGKCVLESDEGLATTADEHGKRKEEAQGNYRKVH